MNLMFLHAKFYITEQGNAVTKHQTLPPLVLRLYYQFLVQYSKLRHITETAQEINIVIRWYSHYKIM